MDNCSNHKKELFGETDMKKAAEAIGDLHYETLAKLFEHLADKINADCNRDRDSMKKELAYQLDYTYHALMIAHYGINKAWQISKPFMPNAEQNVQVSDTREA